MYKQWWYWRIFSGLFGIRNIWSQSDVYLSVFARDELAKTGYNIFKEMYKRNKITIAKKKINATTDGWNEWRKKLAKIFDFDLLIYLFYLFNLDIWDGSFSIMVKHFLIYYWLNAGRLSLFSTNVYKIYLFYSAKIGVLMNIIICFIFILLILFDVSCSFSPVSQFMNVWMLFNNVKENVRFSFLIQFWRFGSYHLFSIFRCILCIVLLNCC